MVQDLGLSLSEVVVSSKSVEYNDKMEPAHLKHPLVFHLYDFEDDGISMDVQADETLLVQVA
jgi:hypothetical protein